MRRLAGPLLFLALAVFATGTRAERLPLTTYTTADGLGGDGVRRIVRDSHGYLWFCHGVGLSRFDGARFTSYGPEDGLPEASVRDLIETRSGNYLVATGAGIYRFEPRGEPLFVPVASGDTEPVGPTVLLEDREQRLWAGTADGLYAVEIEDGRARFREAEALGENRSSNLSRFVTALLESRDGNLWIATRDGLVRRSPDGVSTRYTTRHGLPWDDVRALMEDRVGRVVVGTTGGIARLRAEPAGDGRVVSEVFLEDRPRRYRAAHALFESSDGRLWIGNPVGLGVLTGLDDVDARPEWYTSANGLSQDQIVSFEEDADGNLWIGTEAGGAMRLARGGLTWFAEAEGFEHSRIGSILETRSDELCAVADNRIHCLHEDRFLPTRPNVSVENHGWGWYQWYFQDRKGDWWIPTGEGLFRFSGIARTGDLARAEPTAVYTTADGLGANGVFRAFEDSRGDLWIATISEEQHRQLSRWDRRSGDFQRFGSEDGIPVHTASAFREDGRGNLWIGFYAGGVARYRDGNFERFTTAEGCPAGFIRALHLDRSGRIWIAASRGGVARIDDPGSPGPVFVPFTTGDGLSSNLVSAITEDDRGRLYFGTDRGIDRLDPETGQVRHYGNADGLPNSFVNVAHRDRHGVLWFGTLRGIARLVPSEDPPSHPPPVFIRRLRIAGTPHPVSELGETDIPEMRLSHTRNRVRVEFGGIGFRPGGSLRYQTRIEGVDEEWSDPVPERSIDYANLAPGRYRFLVRAVGPDGQVSPRPATASFTVLPPFWLRWWFLALCGLIVAAVAVSVHRIRVARAVEMERVRTRIATDLHDDIGASLSQIAIHSELLRRRVDGEDASTRSRLSRIAGDARELVDSMADIVWAIDPKRDRLGDVVARMRRFANDTAGASEIACTFQGPSRGDDLALGPNLRRQIFLVFKESVNNAVRHSGCGRLEISFGIENDRLVLEVADDGNGFDPGPESDGHGLKSMKKRAEQLGGSFRLDSRPGEGTSLRVEVPLSRGNRR